MYEVGDRVLTSDSCGIRRFRNSFVTITAIGRDWSDREYYVVNNECYLRGEDIVGRDEIGGMISRDGNVAVLRNGNVMLCTSKSLRSPKGFSISNTKYIKDMAYTTKNQSNSKQDIVAVYGCANTNYMFDKGELIWKEE